jgi:hypothetical protein
VRGRAEHLPGRGDALRVEQLGDAKIGELYQLFGVLTDARPSGKVRNSTFSGFTSRWITPRPCA